VVERKKRSLEELARTMLNETSLSKYFQIDVVNTTSYVLSVDKANFKENTL